MTLNPLPFFTYLSQHHPRLTNYVFPTWMLFTECYIVRQSPRIQRWRTTRT